MSLAARNVLRAFPKVDGPTREMETRWGPTRRGGARTCVTASTTSLSQKLLRTPSACSVSDALVSFKQQTCNGDGMRVEQCTGVPWMHALSDCEDSTQRAMLKPRVLESGADHSATCNAVRV